MHSDEGEPREGHLEARARQQQTDDRLRVCKIAGLDQVFDRAKRDPLHDGMLLLDPVCSPGTVPELLGEKAEGQLIGVAGRIEETGELFEPPGFDSDFFGELPRGAELR